MLYIRSQTALLAALETVLRDTGNARWSDAEIYFAINESLLDWHGRVFVPALYTITDGFSPASYTYALPAYLHPPFNVQVSTPTNYINDTSALTFRDVLSYTIEPEAGADGWVLRYGIVPPTAGGRIVYNLRNGPIPTTGQTLSGTIAADATSLVLAAAVDVGDNGYVLIEQEWIRYAGMTKGATTTTLSNLVRGAEGSTAASHNASTAVAWGIAAPRQDLFSVLMDSARAVLHEMYLTNAAPGEQQKHQQMVTFYRQKAAEYWQGYYEQHHTGRVVLAAVVGID